MAACQGKEDTCDCINGIQAHSEPHTQLRPAERNALPLAELPRRIKNPTQATKRKLAKDSLKEGSRGYPPPPSCSVGAVCVTSRPQAVKMSRAPLDDLHYYLIQSP